MLANHMLEAFGIKLYQVNGCSMIPYSPTRRSHGFEYYRQDQCRKAEGKRDRIKLEAKKHRVNSPKKLIS